MVIVGNVLRTFSENFSSLFHPHLLELCQHITMQNDRFHSLLHKTCIAALIEKEKKGGGEGGGKELGASEENTSAVDMSHTLNRLT